jgi:molybdopterin-binding protein
VEIETPAGIITSVVTSSSIRAVDLRVGDEAVAMFKSTEVLIGKL